MAENALALSRELYANYNVTVLPGSFLAREARNSNPDTGRSRMALVAAIAKCEAPAHRIRNLVQTRAS